MRIVLAIGLLCVLALAAPPAPQKQKRTGTKAGETVETVPLAAWGAREIPETKNNKRPRPETEGLRKAYFGPIPRSDIEDEGEWDAEEPDFRSSLPEVPTGSKAPPATEEEEESEEEYDAKENPLQFIIDMLAGADEKNPKTAFRTFLGEVMSMKPEELNKESSRKIPEMAQKGDWGKGGFGGFGQRWGKEQPTKRDQNWGKEQPTKKTEKTWESKGEARQGAFGKWRPLLEEMSTSARSWCRDRAKKGGKRGLAGGFGAPKFKRGTKNVRGFGQPQFGARPPLAGKVELKAGSAVGARGRPLAEKMPLYSMYTARPPMPKVNIDMKKFFKGAAAGQSEQRWAPEERGNAIMGQTEWANQAERRTGGARMDVQKWGQEGDERSAMGKQGSKAEETKAWGHVDNKVAGKIADIIKKEFDVRSRAATQFENKKKPMKETKKESEKEEPKKKEPKLKEEPKTKPKKEIKKNLKTRKQTSKKVGTEAKKTAKKLATQAAKKAAGTQAATKKEDKTSKKEENKKAEMMPIKKAATVTVKKQANKKVIEQETKERG